MHLKWEALEGDFFLLEFRPVFRRRWLLVSRRIYLQYLETWNNHIWIVVSIGWFQIFRKNGSFNQTTNLKLEIWNPKNDQIEIGSIIFHPPPLLGKWLVIFTMSIHSKKCLFNVLGGALIVLNRISQRSVSGNGATYLKDYGEFPNTICGYGIFTYMKTIKIYHSCRHIYQSHGSYGIGIVTWEST